MMMRRRRMIRRTGRGTAAGFADEMRPVREWHEPVRPALLAAGTIPSSTTDPIATTEDDSRT
jgi:hypothetical protein